MAAAALIAWPLAAQDSTAQQTPRPQRHVVQAGETLWSLAQLYLGDPLLWPEIYRINTLVVEDPHWIFPGEELMLAAADQTAAPVDTMAPPAPIAPDTLAAGDQGQERDVPPPVVPDETPDLAPPPPPPPTTQTTPTVFARSRTSGTEIVPVRTELPYRAIRSGDFYAAGFLTENEELPWAEVLGPVDRHRGIERRGTASATRYERILLRAPEGATYHVGDSVLVAVVGRRVPGAWGRVVIPTGIARVVSAAGRDVEAEVVAQFDRIADGQVAMPVEPFRDPGTRRPAPVEQGMDAEIIVSRDNNELALHQSFLFVNRGRADGVVAGDVFELLRPVDDDRPTGAPPESLGLLQIVHVRDGSATGRLMQVFGLGIGPGTPARLIRKMPG